MGTPPGRVVPFRFCFLGMISWLLPGWDPSASEANLGRLPVEGIGAWPCGGFVARWRFPLARSFSACFAASFLIWATLAVRMVPRWYGRNRLTCVDHLGQVLVAVASLEEKNKSGDVLAYH